MNREANIVEIKRGRTWKIGSNNRIFTIKLPLRGEKKRAPSNARGGERSQGGSSKKSVGSGLYSLGDEPGRKSDQNADKGGEKSCQKRKRKKK